MYDYTDIDDEKQEVNQTQNDSIILKNMLWLQAQRCYETYNGRHWLKTTKQNIEEDKEEQLVEDHKEIEDQHISHAHIAMILISNFI